MYYNNFFLYVILDTRIFIDWKNVINQATLKVNNKHILNYFYTNLYAYKYIIRVYQ